MSDSKSDNAHNFETNTKEPSKGYFVLTLEKFAPLSKNLMDYAYIPHMLALFYHYHSSAEIEK